MIESGRMFVKGSEWALHAGDGQRTIRHFLLYLVLLGRTSPSKTFLTMCTCYSLYLQITPFRLCDPTTDSTNTYIHTDQNIALVGRGGGITASSIPLGTQPRGTQAFP